MSLSVSKLAKFGGLGRRFASPRPAGPRGPPAILAAMAALLAEIAAVQQLLRGLLDSAGGAEVAQAHYLGLAAKLSRARLPPADTGRSARRGGGERGAARGGTQVFS